MISYLPEIAGFFFRTVTGYWNAASASDILAGVLALLVIRKLLQVFDIIKR